jgi:hypothetical protein
VLLLLLLRLDHMVVVVVLLLGDACLLAAGRAAGIRGAVLALKLLLRHTDSLAALLVCSP